MVKPVYCDTAKSEFSTVTELKQQYLFIPQNVKEVSVVVLDHCLLMFGLQPVFSAISLMC